MIVQIIESYLKSINATPVKLADRVITDFSTPLTLEANQIAVVYNYTAWGKVDSVESLGSGQVHSIHSSNESINFTDSALIDDYGDFCQVVSDQISIHTGTIKISLSGASLFTEIKRNAIRFILVTTKTPIIHAAKC